MRNRRRSQPPRNPDVSSGVAIEPDQSRDGGVASDAGTDTDLGARRPWTGRRIGVELVDRAGGSDAPPREIVRHPGGSVVLPIDDDSRILLIRNHRVAVRDALLELPAGTRGDGEDPAEVAARELAEETGFAAGRLEPFGWFWTTPGFTDERLHAFIAHDLEFVGQRLDPGEEIEVVPASVDDVLAMIDDGRIVDAKTIAVVLRWHRREGAS